MSNIERQSGVCGFNVGFCVVVVGGGETEGDEVAADSAAVVGGEDREELEDCWMYELVNFVKMDKWIIHQTREGRGEVSGFRMNKTEQ